MPVIIVAMARPAANRPANLGGGPLEAGDVFVNQLSPATRERYDGTAWSVFAPLIIYSAGLPAGNNRPTANVIPPNTAGGPLQPGDIWVQQNTGLQSRWNGSAWELIELSAGVLPSPVLAGVTFHGNAEQHLAKAAARPFDTSWVPPADGIAYLWQQRTRARVWVINHQLRSTYVQVTAVDTSRTPAVTMIPDITYALNRCDLTFVDEVEGFAVVYASKLTADNPV